MRQTQIERGEAGFDINYISKPTTKHLSTQDRVGEWDRSHCPQRAILIVEASTEMDMSIEVGRERDEMTDRAVKMGRTVCLIACVDTS